MIRGAVEHRVSVFLDGPAKCIDLTVPAHYPKPNAKKRASGFLTGSATIANKTIVRRGINIERGQLKHTGVFPEENRNEKINVGINRVGLLLGFGESCVRAGCG
jgi:hypothetical protein